MRRLSQHWQEYLVHPLSPYLAVLLLYLWGQTAVSADNQWQHLASQFLLLSLSMLPVLYCKYRSIQAGEARIFAIGWWLGGFILFPLLCLLLASVLDIEQIFFNPEQGDFLLLWLWGAESILLVRHGLSRFNMSRFDFRFTLDNVLFLLLLIASLFWALVFNSIDNPVDNQPIHILIDLKRNFVRFDQFISYFMQFLVIYGCLYLAYWINHHILVDKVLTRVGLFHYLCCSVVFILVAVPLLAEVVLLLPINTANFTFLPSQDFNPFAAWNYRIGVLVMLLSLPLILAFKWQENSRRLIELEKQKIHAELMWLQQQVNPHFLFNTLNNLYSLTLTKSDKAPQLILQLANLLRFVVYQGAQQKVSLQDELGYLRDYLDLQQLRVAQKCDFDIRFPASIPDLSISPLLLVNFIENAFKHGIEPSEQPSQLRVEIKLTGRQLDFYCRNSLAADTSLNNKGIGLTNVRRRLNLLYPERFQLNIDHQPDYYEVRMHMELDT